MWRTILENTLGLASRELRDELKERRENPAAFAAELRRRQRVWEGRAEKWARLANEADDPKAERRARAGERRCMNLAELNARRAQRWERKAAKG
jgi:hypothetical protein